MSADQDFRELRTHMNRQLHLEFNDGEIVEAILLGASPGRDRDITYEVTRIIKVAAPRAKGTEIGGTCVAPLDDLKAWRALG